MKSAMQPYYAQDIDERVSSIDNIVKVFGDIDESQVAFYSKGRMHSLHQLFPILAASVHFFDELTPEKYKILKSLRITFKDLLIAMEGKYEHSEDLDSFSQVELNGVEAIIWFNIIKNGSEHANDRQEGSIHFINESGNIVFSNLSSNEREVVYMGQEFPEDPEARKGFGKGIVSKLAVLEGLDIRSSAEKVGEGVYHHSFSVVKAEK